MFGDLACAEENDRDVGIVASTEDRVGVDVDFPQAGAGLAEQRSDLRLGFLAQMAARARVEGYVERACGGQNRVLGTRSAFVGHGMVIPQEPGDLLVRTAPAWYTGITEADRG